MDIDKGIKFGKWEDTTSIKLYKDTTEEIFKKIKISKYNKIADYGGANGIMKNYIPNIITIDLDATKEPDIVDNIITHPTKYDLVVIRYVLHYLNDYQVIKLFNKILKNGTKNILLIQFTNENLKMKYKNSINEFKYFRNASQLQALIPDNFKQIYSEKITVTKEFYKNRLNNDNGIEHQETINAFLLEVN